MTAIQQDNHFLNKLVDSEDHDLWNDFYRRYDELILMIIRNFIKEPDAVKDLAQEVRLHIWKKIHLYKPNLSRFTTWLTRLTKNKVIDFLRQQCTQRKLLNNIDHPEPESSKSDIENIVQHEWQDYIFTLAEKNIKSTVTPKMYSIYKELNSGKSYLEISEEHQLPINSVYVYKRRVITAFNQEIRRLLDDLS